MKFLRHRGMLFSTFAPSLLVEAKLGGQRGLSSRRGLARLVVCCAIGLLIGACDRATSVPYEVIPNDEAKERGLGPEAFRYPIGERQNFLKGMDVVATLPAGAGGVPQKDWPDQLLDKLPQGQLPPQRELKDVVETPNEILGRNTWMLWCGGNEGFWDWLAGHSYGFSDLLKVVDSRNRSHRFDDAGLINEPGMREAITPDENGVWLDVPADDAQSAEKKRVPESIYGRSSGVVGLRVFPNPKFDEQARSRWNPKRYYTDSTYYNDPKLIRPYRVGMSCAFCHASWHPLNPPQDFTAPKWANVSGNIGAQYLRMRMVFGNLLKKDSLVYHILDSQPPGTIDTSLIASDNINNPNAMNSIFGVPQRVVRSFINPQEALLDPALTQPALWGKPDEMLPEGTQAAVWPHEGNNLTYPGPLADKVPKPYWELLNAGGLLQRVNNSNNNPRYVPRILFDGADSIGAWGALARVYLNIGTFYEQWIRLHNPLVGLQPQKPFKIADCAAHSTYWQATQERVVPLRDYFLRITPPMPLRSAKGAEKVLEKTDVVAMVRDESWRVEASRDAKSERARTGAASPEVEVTSVSQKAGVATALLRREKGRRIDVSQLALGRKVFAGNCIVCHSSIQWPERDRVLTEEARTAAGEPSELWDHDPGRWLTDPGYKGWASVEVEKPEFWRNNYLSTDYRIPVTVVRTNPARALATNALGGHMWEDFSSESYKKLPSVGAIRFFNPFSRTEESFTPRHKTPAGSPEGGGGVGFYRPPTLISIWSTAPLLHNNSLGLFNNDPSVQGRLDAFDDAMRKLLWPENRLKISANDTHPYNETTTERLERDHGLIWRTPQVTYLTLPGEQVPELLARIPAVTALKKCYTRWTLGHPSIEKLVSRPWLPSAILFTLAYTSFLVVGRKPSPDLAVVLHRKRRARWLGYLAIFLGLILGALLYLLSGSLGELRIGPIPKGTPVNLLANLNPDADPVEVKRALNRTLEVVAEIKSQHLTDEKAEALLREKVAPDLMKLSKCPDFVMDEGHYFSFFKSMTDAEKNALIELLKTF